jgi:hypothetical protein
MMPSLAGEPWMSHRRPAGCIQDIECAGDRHGLAFIRDRSA